MAGLWGSQAVRAGLIAWGDELAPLPRRTLSMPPWLVAALTGFTALPPACPTLAQPPVILTRETIIAAAAQAPALSGQSEESDPYCPGPLPSRGRGDGYRGRQGSRM